MRRDRTDEYEKRQDELAHAIRERDENFQKYVDANEALLEARAETKRLRKRLGELDAEDDAGDWLYKYEAEAMAAEAEQRGYRKGVEDALKVMKSWEHTGTGPDYSEYWAGAGYAVEEITGEIAALLGEKK